VTGHRLISVLASEVAADAVRKVRLGELSSMGEITQYIASGLQAFLTMYGPQIGAQLIKIVEPAAKKAADIIGPVVEQKLKEHVPMFAAITGGLIGAAILGGVFISRATYRVVRR
jgi:hypothetical protein